MDEAWFGLLLHCIVVVLDIFDCLCQATMSKQEIASQLLASW